MDDFSVTLLALYNLEYPIHDIELFSSIIERVQWDAMTSVMRLPGSAFTELGRIFRVILNDKTGCWNADDVVSLFEELTGNI